MPVIVDNVVPELAMRKAAADSGSPSLVIYIGQGPRHAPRSGPKYHRLEECIPLCWTSPPIHQEQNPNRWNQRALTRRQALPFRAHSLALHQASLAAPSEAFPFTSPPFVCLPQGWDGVRAFRSDRRHSQPRRCVKFIRLQKLWESLNAPRFQCRHSI